MRCDFTCSLLTETVELPMKVEKDWVHMDKVEYDKLEWMKDLPKPTAGDTEVFISLALSEMVPDGMACANR